MSIRRSEALSPEDLIFLEDELRAADPKRWQAKIAPTLLFMFFATAMYTVLALVGAGVLARLLGYRLSNGAWHDDPVTFYGALFVGGGVFLFTAVSSIRWLVRSRRSNAEYHQSIAEDIAAGTVSVEDHKVVSVKLLQDPEHHAFIFLLRLSNDRTLVMYDYDSLNSDADFPPDNKPTLTPCDRISLRSFVKSKRRRWSFSGAPVPLPEPIELVLEPSKWPDDEGWCRVKWENVERHYGAKTGRQAAAVSKRS